MIGFLAQDLYITLAMSLLTIPNSCLSMLFGSSLFIWFHFCLRCYLQQCFTVWYWVCGYNLTSLLRFRSQICPQLYTSTADSNDHSNFTAYRIKWWLYCKDSFFVLLLNIFCIVVSIWWIFLSLPCCLYISGSVKKLQLVSQKIMN